MKIQRISFKNSSKYTFFVNHRFHSVLRLILRPWFERASKNLTIDTLRQPFRAKLEVSIPNPPTENQLCFSFWHFSLKILIIFKVLGNPTKGLVHLELFRPFASEVLAWVHYNTNKKLVQQVFCLDSSRKMRISPKGYFWNRI